MKWPVSRLSEACYINMGQAPPGESYNSDGDGLPLVAGAGDLGEIYPVTTKFTNEPSRIAKNGDIILCIRATIGDRNRANEPVCLGRGVAGLRPRAGTLNDRFLWYWLEHASPELRSKGRGATFLQVTKKDLSELSIPLPPLDEQKRIARILDQADALRAKRRETINQLDALVQSVFLDMFGDPVTNPKGWEKKTLPEVALIFRDGPFGSNLKTSDYKPEGVRVIRLQNVGVNRFIDDDTVYITEEHYQSLPKNHCKPGDVVIGTLGDPNLRACIVPRNVYRALNKADCLLLRTDPAKCVPEFVASLLNIPSLVHSALGLVRGQTRGRISMGRLRELPIPVPPLSIQLEYKEVLSIIDQTRLSILESIESHQTLFSSLQSRAFKGEL